MAETTIDIPLTLIRI